MATYEIDTYHVRLWSSRPTTDLNPGIAVAGISMRPATSAATPTSTPTPRRSRRGRRRRQRRHLRAHQPVAAYGRPAAVARGAARLPLRVRSLERRSHDRRRTHRRGGRALRLSPIGLWRPASLVAADALGYRLVIGGAKATIGSGSRSCSACRSASIGRTSRRRRPSAPPWPRARRRAAGRRRGRGRPAGPWPSTPTSRELHRPGVGGPGWLADAGYCADSLSGDLSCSSAGARCPAIARFLDC